MPFAHQRHRLAFLSAFALFAFGCQKDSSPDGGESLSIPEPPAVVEAVPESPLPVAPSPADVAMPESPETADSAQFPSREEPCPEVPVKKKPVVVKKGPQKAPKSLSAAKPSQPLPKPEGGKSALQSAKEAELALHGRPFLASELGPLIAALYREAVQLAPVSPDSAWERINFALRYCDDGAFFALGASIADKAGDTFLAYVMSERAAAVSSNLNRRAREEGLGIQLRSLKTMREASPSEELDRKEVQVSTALKLAGVPYPEEMNHD